MLEDRDLDVRNNVDWAVLSPDTQVAISRTGAWVPKHPLGLSLAALPAYALFGDAGLLGFNLLQLLALDCLLLLAARRVASETIALGGALLGAAVGGRWTSLCFVPLGLALCGVSLGWRAGLGFLVAAAPFLLALGLLDAHLFGSPFVTPTIASGFTCSTRLR